MDLHIVLVDHLQKTKKEFINLKRQEIHNIFIKTWITMWICFNGL